MLEGLDRIDWDRLKQAGGPATHVPGAIRGLISSDKDVRKRSYWKLDNCVVLQGDLYESVYYVIPFLVEILSSPEVKLGRDVVYDLLIEIANGYAPREVLVHAEGEATSIPLADACQSAIVSGLDVFLGEMENIRSPERKKAAEVLLALGQNSSSVLPRLERLLEHETDEQMKELLSELLDVEDDK